VEIIVASSIILYLKIVWGLPPRLGPSPPPSKSGTVSSYTTYKKNCDLLVTIDHKFILAAIVAMAFIDFKTKNVGSVYIASRRKTNAGAIFLLA